MIEFNNPKESKIFTYLEQAKNKIALLNDDDLDFIKMMNRLENAKGEIEPEFVFPAFVEKNNLYTVSEPEGFELVTTTNLIYDIENDALKIITEDITQKQLILPYITGYYPVEFDEMTPQEYKNKLIHSLNPFINDLILRNNLNKY